MSAAILFAVGICVLVAIVIASAYYPILKRREKDKNDDWRGDYT